MISAVIGVSGMILYVVAAVLAYGRTRKVGLVLIFPAFAMISCPFVVVYGLWVLVPVVAGMVIAFFAVRRIWKLG